MNNDREMRGKGMNSEKDRSGGNMERTQMRNGQKTTGGVGNGIDAGRPDAGGNRSGGMGQASQHSGAQGSGMQSRNVETDGGAPSAQTSGAKDESGQL